MERGGTDVIQLRQQALGLATLALYGAACTPEIESRTRSRPTTTDAAAVDTVSGTTVDGVVTGTLSASATNAQLLEGVAGSTVVFPPGSLSIDTTLTVEEGEALAASASELGLDSSGITAASPSVIVASSQSVDPLTPFTISLPLSGAALALLQDDPYAKLVILHKRTEYSANQVVVGIMLRDAISIADGTVSFKTNHFGIFQAAYTSTVISEDKSAVTTNPILNKKDATTPLTITYSATSPTSPSNVTTFAIRGTADNGADQVLLYSDASCTQQLASGTKIAFESAAGISIPAPANTTVDVYAIAKGLVRPASPCTRLTSVVSDTTPPPAPTVTSANATTNDATPTWTWTKPTGASGTFRYKLNSSDLTTGATETGLQTYTASSLADGNHTLYVQAKDVAGNWSTTGSYTVAIDTVAPVVTIVKPSVNEYVPGRSFTVSGTCENGLTVTISSAAIATVTTSCGSNAFSATAIHSSVISTSAAVVQLTATQTDAAGNNGTSTLSHKYGLNPSGLELWLDETTIATSPVNWTDRTDAGATTHIATSLSPTAQNGRNWVTFSGASMLKIPDETNLTFTPNSQDLSIFVVFEVEVANGGVIFAKGEGGTPDIGYELSIDSGSNALDLNLGGQSYATGISNDGEPHIVSIVSKNNDYVRVYKNSDLTPTADDATAQGSDDGSGYPLVVGARQMSVSPSYGDFLNGKVAELIIINRIVDDTERQNLIDYLHQKWMP